jgi:hypothetical protein
VRGELIEGRPKAAAGVRAVPIPGNVVDLLERMTCRLSPDDFVFTGMQGAPAAGRVVQVPLLEPGDSGGGPTGLPYP